MRPLGLALLALLVIWPGAAAQAPAEGEPVCIIFVRPSADFTLLEITADLELAEDARMNLSARVDGDGDGSISQEEVASYEQDVRIVYDRATMPEERRILRDGFSPENLTIHTRLRNWTGPVETARNGTVTEIRYYRYTEFVRDWHELEGNLYARPVPTLTPEPVIELIVIEAPRDWTIRKLVQQNATGGLDNVTYPETRSVSVYGFDLSRGSVLFWAPNMTQQPDERPRISTPTPSPGILAVLALTGLVAWSTRWRSRP